MDDESVVPSAETILESFRQLQRGDTVTIVLRTRVVGISPDGRKIDTLANFFDAEQGDIIAVFRPGN